MRRVEPLGRGLAADLAREAQEVGLERAVGLEDLRLLPGAEAIFLVARRDLGGEEAFEALHELLLVGAEAEVDHGDTRFTKCLKLRDGLTKEVKPGGAGVGADTASIEARLRDLARRHKKELFEPFMASLDDVATLQAEMQRIVGSLQVFFNKWTVELIVVLAQGGVLRFNELREQLPGISGRTLSQRLKELEEQGLVARTIHDERPVRIEYALTKKGLDVAYLALPLALYLANTRRG